MLNEVKHLSETSLSQLKLAWAVKMKHTRSKNIFLREVFHPKFDLLISSVVTVADEKVYEVTYADH